MRKLLPIGMQLDVGGFGMTCGIRYIILLTVGTYANMDMKSLSIGDKLLVSHRYANSVECFFDHLNILCGASWTNQRKQNSNSWWLDFCNSCDAGAELYARKNIQWNGNFL